MSLLKTVLETYLENVMTLSGFASKGLPKEYVT